MSEKRSFSTQALKTPVFQRGQNLTEFIVEQVPAEMIEEKMILAVTSKIVSLAENRLVSRDSVEKPELIRSECEEFLGMISYDCHLTIQHGTLLPAAGIDESNSETGEWILLPADPFASAEKLWRELREQWSVENFGVIITDSHTTPLRRGVSGVSLSHWGFAPVIDKRSEPDLFGRPMKMTQINSVDAFATAAVWCMGEADDSRPLALIHGAPLEWNQHGSAEEIRIPLEEDLYAPLLKSTTPPD